MNEIKENDENTAAKYPGVAIDIADNEKVTEEAEEERTETLGFNPRNDS